MATVVNDGDEELPDLPGGDLLFDDSEVERDASLDTIEAIRALAEELRQRRRADNEPPKDETF